MSSHDLNIERGRYNNLITPINQRICTKCELSAIDDDIHLFLHCNAMNNEREILLNSVAPIINMQPTNDMFLRIMTSGDTTVVSHWRNLSLNVLNISRVKNTEYILSAGTRIIL